MKPTIKTLISIPVLLFTLLLALIACCASAGQLPFTANQFPVWYATQVTPVSITNAAETDLFTIPVPPNFMGNSGFCQITLIADGDAGSTNKILTGYLGPIGHTNATALFTNTYKQSVSTPITTTITPYVGGYSNLVYSTTFTNFNAGATKQTITVGSQTNGLYLTITGATGDTHGTYLTLDAVIIKALQGP